jgi:hypothetical protein
MPGTSRLLEKLVWPSSVCVCVAASCSTRCQRPCIWVIDGVIENSVVSRSLSTSVRLTTSSDNRSSAGSPMGMS